MKRKIFIGICLLFILFYLPTSAQEKLRRSDSFFGWHFDFHATAADKNLGENFDTELLDHFLRQTKPDYIQIDSKGHPGFSSYPTKVGYSADSFVKDPIRLWKDTADKHHIPLFVHYSGILDEEAIKQNPEWGRMNADGSRDNRRAGYCYALENPVATINSYGKGKIGAVYMDLSPADAQYRNPLFRNLLKQLVEELVSEVTLQVQGSDEVHVVLSRKGPCVFCLQPLSQT